MTDIAAGRAGYSANTFSEGGFGGQGLPDVQFASTPALSITAEYVSTTDAGWGDFAWGEHEWGHPDAQPRTHVTFITATATGSLVADLQASDSVQFSVTSATTLAYGDIEASVSIQFTADPEADASMGASPIEMQFSTTPGLTGHGDVAADLTSQLSFVTTASATGAAGVETSFSFGVANADLTATGDVAVDLTSQLSWSVEVTAFVEAEVSDSISFTATASPSLTTTASETVQFVATPGLDGLGDVEVSKTTQFAVADATLLGDAAVEVTLPHTFTFTADADRLAQGEFSDTVTFTFSASGDAMKDAEASISSTFTVGEATIKGMTDMDADPITASFTSTPDLDGLADAEYSDTALQFTTSSTATGFADCEVSLESELPFTVTVSGFGDVTYSETLTFAVSKVSLGWIFNPPAGMELEAMTVVKADYDDDIIIFKPDYNDIITIVKPDYQSDTTILDVDVAA